MGRHSSLFLLFSRSTGILIEQNIQRSDGSSGRSSSLRGSPECSRTSSKFNFSNQVNRKCAVETNAGDFVNAVSTA